jgi:hypothetical protein
VAQAFSLCGCIAKSGDHEFPDFNTGPLASRARVLPAISDVVLLILSFSHTAGMEVAQYFLHLLKER